MGQTPIFKHSTTYSGDRTVMAHVAVEPYANPTPVYHYLR